MSDTQQTLQQAARSLADLPLWVVIILAMASGVSGELWRVSREKDLEWPDIAKRVALRFGASVMFGLATFMLALYFAENVLFAAACCIIIGTMGADVASALYERWVARKIDQVKP
tara:strand:+ start:1033 stop:1377 length:345 start_codon:yes stop_codon:yes gene_type:complete